MITSKQKAQIVSDANHLFTQYAASGYASGTVEDQALLAVEDTIAAHALVLDRDTIVELCLELDAMLEQE